MTLITSLTFLTVLILAAICIRNVRLMKIEVEKFKTELDAKFLARQVKMDDTVNDYRNFLDRSRAEFLELPAK